MDAGTDVETHVVDSRVFLLGLDQLYREALKRHERTELLACAQRVAAALRITAANVPVEGYYDEDEPLCEYFRLLRALQQVEESRTGDVAALPEFRRLRAVASAPLYGHPQQRGKLLPVGHDALSEALLRTRPKWTVAALTTAAHTAAQEMDDISLVGLASQARDPVVLAALRESVVLYALVVETFGMPRPRQRVYVWKVDADLAERARRFVHAFNTLFDEALPTPGPDEARRYWHACGDNDVLGRCARIGYDDAEGPIRYYHWAICSGSDGELTVQDFWHSEIWTTTRYRAALRLSGRCLELPRE